MPARAVAFPAYERFFPAAPPDEGQSGDLQKEVAVLRRLAEARLAGMAELREYARHPGTNLESLLHFIRRLETDLRRQVKDGIKDVKLMRSQLRALKRSPRASQADRDTFSATCDARDEITKIDQDVLDAIRACRRDLEELRSARLVQYSEEWLAYLDQLSRDPNTAPIADALRQFWQWIAPTLWAPEAAPMEDSFLMTWDRDDHRIQVILDSDTSFGWSYYNQRSQEVVMEEGQTTGRWSKQFKAAVARITE